MNFLKTTFLSVLALVATLGLAQAAPKVGSPAPALSAVDTKGKTWNLAELKGKRIILEWTNDQCPYVIKHYGSGNMQALQTEYTGKGVVWLSVSSSAAGKQGNHTAEEWKQINEKHGSKATAVLLDGEGTVGKLYGAKTTPHMYVINPEGTLIYQGAIDDKPSADAKDIPGAKNYVKAALDEAMAGKPVTTGQTKPYGCSVKYK